MRVILRDDVKDVGNKGDVVEVANGFGRNYLLPRGLAFVATPGAETQAGSMRRSREVKDAAERAAAQDVAKSLVNAPVTIEARVGSDEKLFGSITTADIAEAVQAQLSVEIDRRRIELDEPLKELGVVDIPVRLHAEVNAAIRVAVVAQ